MTTGPDIEALYRAHGHIVLRRARRLLGNDPDAFEVLQEVFMSLLENPEQLRCARSVVGFLYGATSHCCLNRLRNQRGRQRLLEDHARQFMPVAAAPTRADDLAAAAELLSLLPEDQARAAFHHHCDGMTHEEIAQLIGCSRRHVGDLLARVSAWFQTQEEPV